jgi:ABC-type cobalamin transport system ATPase subunit
MKPKTIADLLAHGSAESLIGRTRELALLSELLAPGGPAVAYVHGPYGIGKSALLAAFQTPLSLRGIDIVRSARGGGEMDNWSARDRPASRALALHGRPALPRRAFAGQGCFLSG